LSKVSNNDSFAVVYIDGASKGNPGPAGVGIVLKLGNNVENYSKFIGRATNNQAEYHALIKALEILLAKNVRRVRVFTDSVLLARQVRGEFKVRNSLLKDLHKRVKELIAHFTEFEIKNVGREVNQEADRLANQAIARFKQ